MIDRVIQQRIKRVRKTMMSQHIQPSSCMTACVVSTNGGHRCTPPRLTCHAVDSVYWAQTVRQKSASFIVSLCLLLINVYTCLRGCRCVCIAEHVCPTLHTQSSSIQTAFGKPASSILMQPTATVGHQPHYIYTRTFCTARYCRGDTVWGDTVGGRSRYI